MESVVNHGLQYREMSQSWNKFCFTEGIFKLV